MGQKEEKGRDPSLFSSFKEFSQPVSEKREKQVNLRQE